MKLRKVGFFLMAFAVLYWCDSIFAQTTSAGRGDFTEDTVYLSFNFPRVAAPLDLSDVFSRWGVGITAGGGGSPVLVNAADNSGGGDDEIPPEPQFFLVLSNQPPGESSAGLPLIFDFERPVRRVGFVLGNGGDGAMATLTAYDAAGNVLGSVMAGAVPDSFDEPLFAGVQTSAEAGISKVTVDYGDSAEPEQVALVAVDFLDRPLFTTVLAQVGRGQISRRERLETTISIINLDATTARGRIVIFDNDGNEVQPLGADGQGELDLSFRLPAFLATSFDTRELLLPEFSGYAVVRSNVPVAAVARFQAFTFGSALVSEAGVGGDRARTFFVGAVQRKQPERVVDLTGLETALALANPGQEPARVEISVFEGVQLGDPNAEPVRVPGMLVELGPGEHIARFLSQLVPSLSPRDFEGSIVIRSSRPIAATLIETVRGLPSSSVPFSPIAR